MNVSSTASQSLSINYPKKEGTFDPNNEDHDANGVHVIPETWISKIDENDKVKIVAADLAD